MSGKRESCMSCFRGNKMPGCLTLEIRFLYVSPRCIYDKYRSGRLCSFGESSRWRFTMYRYADAFRCSRRNFLCFEESCRDLTQRPVRVDEKCLWREFSVFPYDGINTPDTVSQQYPELTKLCLRYFAQDKNTDSFRKQQAVPRFFSFRRFILENLRFLYRRPF